MSSVKIDMIKDILSAANIQNCGESNEIVGENQNEIDDNVKIECRAGFSGVNCEQIDDICIAQEPCDNDGICRSKGTDFTCDCPIGYTGDICQYRAVINTSARFHGNSYIELNRSTVAASSTESAIMIAVMFSTSKPNGLLFWYGQNKDETSYNGTDYLALAVVEGYLEYSFRLDSQEETIRNLQNRVDDNMQHVAIVKQTGNKASLEMDSYTLYGESRPTDRKTTYLPGHVFIGKFCAYTLVCM